MKLHSFSSLLATAAALLAPTTTAIPTPFDVSLASSSLFSRQSGFTPIVGLQGNVQPRLPLTELQRNNADVFNMYILALESLQAVAESSDLSYYKISGIHGRPFIPWQYPVSATEVPNAGYCTHSSALFATWHRPYLILLEQTLNQHAVDVAAKFNGSNASKYQAAAKKVRLPYWDWATDGSNIPPVVMQPTITVTKPGNGGLPTVTPIPNPLFQYNFTNSNYLTTYFEVSYATVNWTRRQPDTISGASRNDLANSGMVNTYTSRRQNTFNLFSIDNFGRFSNTAAPSNGSTRATSVEAIHNEVHGIIGGRLGHMSRVPYSAFDPIFWLHHVQVDRLTAMYQAVWPGLTVERQLAVNTFGNRANPGEMDDINTKLFPFRHPDGAEWTSRDVSTAGSIWTYGYSYPEVPAEYQTRSGNDLKAFVSGRVNALYGPSVQRNQFSKAPQDSDMSAQRQEWVVDLIFDQFEIDGPFEVVVFVGDVPEDPSTWLTAENLVGGSVSFTDFDMSSMSQEISSSIPLTQTLIDLKIGLDASAVVPYLEANLHWAILQEDDSISLDKLPSLKISVSSASVEFPRSPNKLPVWGDSNIYYEITKGKAGGLSESDS